MDPGCVIRFQNLGFGYPGGEVLFRDVSLDLAEGGFYLVRGASGTGKSTLLRLMARLEEPDSGGLFFRGRAYGEIPAPELRRSVLYVRSPGVRSLGPCLRVSGSGGQAWTGTEGTCPWASSRGSA